MSHLENPTIEVKPLTDNDFRVCVEAECVKLKFDVSLYSLLRIAEECLEAIADHNSEVDECEFCFEGRCDLTDALEEAMRALRTKSHVRGAKAP